MEKSKAEILLEKYKAGTCSAEEKKLVEAWFFQEDRAAPVPSEEDLLRIKQEMWAVVQEQKNLSIGQRSFSGIVRIAALVLLFLAFGWYFYSAERQSVENTKVVDAQKEKATNKAVLTLADGTTLTLDEANSGELARQSGIRITKTRNGQLIYSVSGAAPANNDVEIAYNTVSTPRGGQYEVILPDGSHVWLNAASSIKFPVSFPDHERKVELTGEGYFDVARNARKPFRVITGTQEVEVLGTRFNVNAYSESPGTLTTLLEGSVQIKVPHSHEVNILKPGQQAELKDNSFNISRADTSKAVGWKSGYFVFNNAEIKTAMSEISRWYDIEVVYQGDLSDIHFGGSISRSNPLSQTLKILQSTGNFRLEVKGRKVTVMP